MSLKSRKLTFTSLVGIRRGQLPSDDALAPGSPLRPLTVPNAVSLARLLLIPVFLYLAFRSQDGRDALAIVIFSVAASTDFLDGLLARALGQYSRLGALLDPLVDRLLVLSSVVVAWHFNLLPRWAIYLVIAREVVMVIASRVALKLGLGIEVNWPGRIAMVAILFSFWLSMIVETSLSAWIFIAGALLSLLAAGLYFAKAIHALRIREGISTPNKK